MRFVKFVKMPTRLAIIATTLFTSTSTAFTRANAVGSTLGNDNNPNDAPITEPPSKFTTCNRAKIMSRSVFKASTSELSNVNKRLINGAMLIRPPRFKPLSRPKIDPRLAGKVIGKFGNVTAVIHGNVTAGNVTAGNVILGNVGRVTGGTVTPMLDGHVLACSQSHFPQPHGEPHGEPKLILFPLSCAFSASNAKIFISPATSC